MEFVPRAARWSVQAGSGERHDEPQPAPDIKTMLRSRRRQGRQRRRGAVRPQRRDRADQPKSRDAANLTAQRRRHGRTAPTCGLVRSAPAPIDTGEGAPCRVLCVETAFRRFERLCQVVPRCARSCQVVTAGIAHWIAHSPSAKTKIACKPRFLPRTRAKRMVGRAGFEPATSTL